MKAEADKSAEPEKEKQEEEVEELGMFASFNISGDEDLYKRV